MNVVLGDRELLDEALRYSTEAIKIAPQYAPMIGTQGAVFVRMFRPDKGIQLLRSALSRHSIPSARASTFCWLAIAESQKGNSEEAKKWLNKAHQTCPNLHLM